MISKYWIALVLVAGSINLFAQHSYNGNTNSGFGGAIGGGSLSINNDEVEITLIFNRGASPLDSIGVIYIDSKEGGYTSTLNFTDDTSPFRRAISTRNGSINPTVFFPSGFEADYAVAFDSQQAILYEIVENGSHVQRYNGSLTPVDDSSASTHDFDFIYTELDISEGERFDFVVTYTSSSSFISNETFGNASSIIAGNDGINPGYNGSITFSSYYTYPNVWTGEVDNDWSNPGNWTGGTPGNSERIYIPKVTNQPTVTTAISVDQLTLASGATIIAQSSFDGTVLFKRSLLKEQWYLMGTPVSGEQLDDLISANMFDNGTGSHIGLAYYDNTQTSNRWVYLSAASTGGLLSGRGFAVRLADGHVGDFIIRGQMPTTDIAYGIQNSVSTGGNSFNLVSNAYPSYLAANSNASSTDNLLTVNQTALTESTIWLWSSSLGIYQAINQASGSFFVAPGQGFFVNAAGSNSFQITEAMQSHQPTDTFQRANRPEIRMTMSNAHRSCSTDIYYFDGATNHFDNGFDSSVFGGGNLDFAIYTQLVEGNHGQKLAIQSLPNAGYQHMIVPIGVIASPGQITFSINSINLPSGYKVYLEDRVASNFIRLDVEGSKYDVTLTSADSELGRFYLYLTTESLSTGSIEQSSINTYVIDGNTLRIVGVHQQLINVEIFDMLGKKILSETIRGNGVNDMKIPASNLGIYVVCISNKQRTWNKKIVVSDN